MSVYCETTLNYARGEETTPVPVTIENGRDARDLSFEECGFALLDHKSDARDWHSERHLAEVHGPEVEKLAQELTGCDQTLAYPPLVRSPAAAKKESDYAPIEFVHSDFTEDYRFMVSDPDRPYGDFITPLLTQHGLTHASLQNASRLAMIQFWRNIGATKPDYPIAFCDARTTPRSMLGKIVVPEYGSIRLEFETFYANETDASENRWYTFPELGINEVIAFRTYDSKCADEGLPFWTLHSAFRDPNVGDDAPRRESVEMRVLGIWD